MEITECFAVIGKERSYNKDHVDEIHSSAIFLSGYVICLKLIMINIYRQLRENMVAE